MKKLVYLFTSLLLSGAVNAAEYQIETVAEGFELPWSIDFLPDGGYLVTTRPGEIYRLSADGEKSEPLEGAPPTYFAGQGGYFDIVLDPNFSENNTVYLAYAGGTPETNGTTITRATLDESGFVDAEVIFTASPTKDTPLHYGGKMLFLPDGTLMVTTGDGFQYREAPLDKSSHLGKVIRINDDGSIPEGNPFSGEDGDPLVFSYGHRNPQGMAIDSETGDVYLHEHGPKGGDEVNLISAGANYGWPAVTYGDNYTGAYVSPLKQYPGVTDPLHYWVPSIAPSGLVVYRGQMFPEWQGDLLVGALVDKEVRLLEMDNGEVVNETPLFSEIDQRIRDVRVGPEGQIYLLTDEGRVLRVTAK